MKDGDYQQGTLVISVSGNHRNKNKQVLMQMKDQQMIVKTS